MRNFNITPYIELAKPVYEFYIKNLSKDFSTYIKYNGIELEGSRIYFKFNSTGYSFNFSIEAGFDIDGSYYKLKARSSDIFREFGVTLI